MLEFRWRCRGRLSSLHWAGTLGPWGLSGGLIREKNGDVPGLVMTNSLPWKDPASMLLRTVNHLFRLGPSIPWRTVSHNQAG